jgi:hypothetical protein
MRKRKQKGRRGLEGEKWVKGSHCDGVLDYKGEEKRISKVKRKKRSKREKEEEDKEREK